jgi:hypothetical protein
MSKQVSNEEENNTKNLETNENETESDNDVTEEMSDEGCDRIPIDLSQNEVYRGVCTLFEDEDGNNILEYISLLHTELIGINKSLENLRSIKKDISRLADCAELFFKSSKEDDTDKIKKSEDGKKKVKKETKETK